MDKPGSDEAVWFQYIMKLNDRSLSKSRSSGFNTWAICGALAFLLYKILDKLPLIVNTPETRSLFLVTFPTLTNLSYALIILIVYLFVRGEPISELRLMPKLSRLTRPIVFVPLILISIIVAFLNFYICFMEISYYLPKWPYFVFSLYIVINVLIPTFKKIKIRMEMKSEYAELPLLEVSPYFSRSSLKSIAMQVLLIIGLILFACATYSTTYVFMNSEIINNIDIIIFSLEIILFLILIIFLFILISSEIRKRFLVDLEQRIVLEDLNADKIRTIFIKEFLGETTRDWVVKIEAKLKELYDSCCSAFNEAEIDMKSLADIDKKYSYEIDGRVKEIYQKVEKHFKEYNEYLNKLMGYVKHLIKEKAFIEDEAVIERIMSSWKSQVKDIDMYSESLDKTRKSIAEDKGEKTEC